jgi:alkanesulfonate monooxygenase SsuD/methylene tetrahydromethanopterin reductase-like flavin-dependent oxidoreductase (luciferase family)
MIAPGWGVAVNTFLREPGETDVQEIAQLARLVEDAGFDSVWVGDHLLWHLPILDALSVLSGFAAQTKRITVGTAIYLLGLRHPLIAAKEITSLNVLSGGRLVLGVGVGGENPEEFEAAGVSHRQRGRLLDDGLRALVEQWNPDSGGTRLTPIGPPVPLLVGGRSSATRRRVLAFDAGWIAAFVSPSRIREEIAILEQERGAELPVALNVYLRTDSDGERARREAGTFLASVYAMDEAPLMRYCVAGTPATCAAELAQYAEAGVSHFILRPAAWEQSAQINAWHAELLPLVADIPLRGSGRDRSPHQS